MKRIIQLVLFLFLILIIFVFYKTYFTEVKKTEIEIKQKDQISSDDKIRSEKGNNLIKNLKYNVTFDDKTEYIINSDFSELSYQDNVEMIKMKNVKAIFIEKSIFPITITANNALYNNSTYDTYFSENVEINYMDNIIFSNKIDLNFKENIILIYENVKYEGEQGTIKSDNIKINLITKKIQIYMNNEEQKVEMTTR